MDGNTYFAVAEDDLCVEGADCVVVEPDTARRVSAECDLLFVDGVRRDDFVWFQPFHQAKSPISSDFCGVHLCLRKLLVTDFQPLIAVVWASVAVERGVVVLSQV